MNDKFSHPAADSQSQYLNPRPYPPQKAEEDEINFIDYWKAIVKYRLMVISITVLFTIAAIAIAFEITPIYRAEALLAPASDDEQRSLSAITSQLGGLASLAGINLGSSGSNTDQVLATLTSRAFISDFVVDRHLMQILFSDKWDVSKKGWRANTADEIPTVLDAYMLFSKDILSVTADKKTGLVTLAAEWKDPNEAASWVNDLVARINRHEKEQAINEAENSILYLKKQLAHTSVVEMQQSIYQLMEAQTKKIMLANVRDQYAFKVIDPAVVPEKKIRPKRAVISIFGFMLGLMVSFLIAIIKSSISENKMK